MDSELIGGDQTAGLVEPVTDGVAEKTGEANGADLKTRVMQGGDFAWEQIQKRDRHSSELANKVKELEPVEQLVRFAGGDTNRLMQLLQVGNRALQIGSQDTTGVFSKALETGRVELPSAAQNGQDEDEWIDPDAKKVRDSLTAELNAVKAQLGDLARVASSAELRANEQRIEANINRALKDFEGDKEILEKASQAIYDRYRAAYKMAENGDATQARLLDQLASDQGQGILDAITAPVMREYVAKLAKSSKTQATQDGSAQGRRGTDAPTVNPSRPGPSPLPPRPKGRVNADYALQVMRAAAAQRGIVLKE